MRGGFNRNLFLLMEIYKKIPGIPNYYEASSLGNIRVLDHYVKGRWGYALIKGKILKQTTCKKGYKTVTLEKSKVYKVHRLVALAFIPNLENKPCVDHIDGNRANNEIKNLRWTTHKENNNNPITIERYRERKDEKHPSAKKVYQFDSNGVFIKAYNCVKSCEKEGFNKNGVARCARGERGYYNGYIWRYKL